MKLGHTIQNIKKDDKVLEIGPGKTPHPRADILLEKKFTKETEAYEQRGHQEKGIYKKPIKYYDGGKFPFKNKEFDYIICSHVIEHVPPKELTLFISEMERVGKGGYIEFPKVFYEFINYQKVHKWFMNFRDNTILFYDKSKFKSNYIHLSYREMFYGNDKYVKKTFNRYKNFYFYGYEWQDKINYKIVKNLDELIIEQDYIENKKYFSNFEIEKINNYKKIKIYIKKIFYFLKYLIKKN